MKKIIAAAVVVMMAIMIPGLSMASDPLTGDWKWVSEDGRLSSVVTIDSVLTDGHFVGHLDFENKEEPALSQRVEMQDGIMYDNKVISFKAVAFDKEKAKKCAALVIGTVDGDGVKMILTISEDVRGEGCVGEPITKTYLKKI